MTNYKLEKINNIIEEELGQIVQQEIDFDQGVFMSVSQVEISESLGSAKVWIDAWPIEAGADVLKILRKHKGVLRCGLAGRVKMRRVPDLKFFIDREEIEDEQQRRKVEEILEEIKKTKTQGIVNLPTAGRQGTRKKLKTSNR
ncbi:ribosome-binding factor A [Candidatus Kuenenbacteria bacterium RIFCSPHIGHO2_12_FULL_42_14]|uniref:Ribosome-binding factor A n=3 Tax=Candidatus Kueneniibacteriota TaxID=1752740 RepID=A0A0G0YX15_9BACT|nr:MAG: Ribosome-binding factor A [Candidatus Kuenenbacteria bacterium GW2011_GWA2_42_15]OGG95849.1 MAG: ribosome-binding factor A [Candidatus Kuenenbacteria bacterium RBG_16_41_7]OGG99821.1 MAG: ribosome-binding factor A [Candidatus Kuenenbacteria bacterium RIFCSPHIGHO2_12_FULL_42_14]